MFQSAGTSNKGDANGVAPCLLIATVAFACRGLQGAPELRCCRPARFRCSPIGQHFLDPDFRLGSTQTWHQRTEPRQPWIRHCDSHSGGLVRKRCSHYRCAELGAVIVSPRRTAREEAVRNNANQIIVIYCEYPDICSTSQHNRPKASTQTNFLSRIRPRSR